MAVEWDEQGARFKPFRQAVAESSDIALEDGCEVRGGLTCLHMCRRFVQHGGDPKTWLLAFSREHGIGARDRTHHELASLTQCLWLAGTYDAVNLGGLVSLEVIARRIAAISEAYRNAPGGQPRWETSKYISGTADPYDLVSAELRSHVARQTKEEAEREAVMTKSRAVESAKAQAEALQWGGLPRQPDDAGKGKGKGKPKGGGKGTAKGDPAPAVEG